MRELRQTTGVGEQRESEDNLQKQQNQAPGQSKQTPGNGGQHATPLQQPDSMAFGPVVQPPFNNSDFLETSLISQYRSAHSGGSPRETRERSTTWIA
jgi:hypothetical protein